MEVFRSTREEAEQARGIVIAIDVIRAFSVASYAFANGARGIWLVRTVDEAHALHAREPEAWLIGEIGGRLIPGFNCNNSPAQIAKAPLAGRQLIQRTGAGTQEAVGAINASCVLLGALTNARATAAYASLLASSTRDCITLLPTASHPGNTWNEDEMCADYIQALLNGEQDASAILARGRERLESDGRLNLWQQGEADFPAEDIEAVFNIDCFDFALVGQHQTWQGITYVEVHQLETSALQ
ncbi:2-phosphosulfolactate phosphatase [Ktedonosporobacter rubrisoli]|uniref:Probable 2-phosphosulfolactate phosphatase n=1 Tax=Ktedonosporobacter rubrisoli TaxID=2509675 RepID=A0A4P6K1T4_KTERU|nr:2-phosphosulfolactate phosphatase [Ktedonosporobacter rubrisoli]QBD82069.1 2-phosphosulfolactate phosphatase [Ktedonosporobacter rubrisoli]